MGVSKVLAKQLYELCNGSLSKYLSSGGLFGRMVSSVGPDRRPNPKLDHLLFTKYIVSKNVSILIQLHKCKASRLLFHLAHLLVRSGQSLNFVPMSTRFLWISSRMISETSDSVVFLTLGFVRACEFSELVKWMNLPFFEKRARFIVVITKNLLRGEQKSGFAG